MFKFIQEQAKIWIMQSIFTIIMPSISAGGLYASFKMYMPEVSGVYIYLGCWLIFMLTLLSFKLFNIGKQGKKISTSFNIVFNNTHDIQFDKQTAKNICYYYCEGNYTIIQGLENKITFIVIFQKPLSINYFFEVSSPNNKGNFFVTLQHKDNMFCRISLEGKDILQKGAIYNIKANF